MAAPTVVSATSQDFTLATNSYTVNVPSTTGDMLVVIMACDWQPTLATLTPGWTLLTRYGTDPQFGVFVRNAQSAEAGTMTIQLQTAEAGTVHVYKIGAGTFYSSEVLADIFDYQEGTDVSTTTPDPVPSILLSWGNADYLSLVALSGNDTGSTTAAPANYSGDLSSNQAGGTGQASLYTARRALSATNTENPGPWTRTATGNVIGLILIVRPSATASQTVTASGVATAEAVGSPTIIRQQFVSPTAVASGFAAGSPSARHVRLVLPTAIGSGFAAGTPLIRHTRVTPTGIATGFASGTPAISVGAVTVSPSAIATRFAAGTAAIAVGSVTIQPTGVAPGAIGEPEVVRSGAFGAFGLMSGISLFLPAPPAGTSRRRGD